MVCGYYILVYSLDPLTDYNWNWLKGVRLPHLCLRKNFVLSCLETSLFLDYSSRIGSIAFVLFTYLGKMYHLCLSGSCFPQTSDRIWARGPLPLYIGQDSAQQSPGEKNLSYLPFLMLKFQEDSWSETKNVSVSLYINLSVFLSLFPLWMDIVGDSHKSFVIM